METFVLHHKSVMGVFYYIAKYENVESFILKISEIERYQFSKEDFQLISFSDFLNQKIGMTSPQLETVLDIDWNDHIVKINSEKYIRTFEDKEESLTGWIIYIDESKLESLYCYTCWRHIFDDIIKYLK